MVIIIYILKKKKNFNQINCSDRLDIPSFPSLLANFSTLLSLGSTDGQNWNFAHCVQSQKWPNPEGKKERV